MLMIVSKAVEYDFVYDSLIVLELFLAVEFQTFCLTQSLVIEILMKACLESYSE